MTTKTVPPQPSDAKQRIDLREGMHQVFASDHPATAASLLALTWWCSAALDGKPVRCVGILPGVILQVSTRLDSAGLQALLAQACASAMARLGDWIEIAEAHSIIRLPLPSSDAVVAMGQIHLPRKPAVLLERRYAWQGGNTHSVSQ